MSDAAQQDYAAALAAYRDALARLQEAKRHIPPSPADRYRQRKREKREAALAYYRENKEAVDAANAKANEVTARALVLLHQKLNFIGDVENASEGSVRVRMPVVYTVHSSKEDDDA